MNVMKKVLSWMFVAFLLAITLQATKVRADGTYGVTETTKEILVEVPKFCRPLKVKWEIQWDETPYNENLMKGFIYADKGAKIKANPPRPGVLKVYAVWSGGETIHIPKFDTKGKPIKIKRVSIIALGDEFADFSPKNWGYISQDSRWTDGAIISPPVSVGTWGSCT